ncbi:MAG: 5-guanidino-2-oxopentanoate decarboxylase [Aestuariivirga sp.]
MSSRAELSVGEALVGLLEAYGVDTIFGIPGVHNVEMYRALPRSKIKHVLVRHEQGAGFMADGFARATGNPGVCFTITGPGLLNILTPMGQAWSDSSNVLVISTALDIGDAAQGRGRLHEMLDQRAAAATVTSLAMRAYTARDVRDCIARAFANFAAARPRPAYLEIPLDVLQMPAGDGWTARTLLPKPSPSKTQITLAAKKLDGAKQPIILLGGGALDAGSSALQIAEKLGCSIITTTAGKGAIREDHPLCLGYCMGNSQIQKLLQASDCILAVGTELSETDFWDTQVVVDKNLIRVDIDPAAIARPHTAEIPILGDAKETLEALAPLINAKAPSKKPALSVQEDDALRVMLGKVLATIREALPEDTVIASDMTQIAYAANIIFPMYMPRTWLHPVGFGTLGFGLPAGIGAKFGVGKKPVAVIIGDYGIQFTINELGTAAEHKLPLVILMWNNNALGQIRDDMVSKGIQPNAVTLRNPDFQMLAKAYGCIAEKPSSLKALSIAIKAALAADGPTFIEMTPAMVNG